MLPSFLSLGLYFLYRKYNIESVGFGENDVLHPYAVGVLVSTATFLIIFKLNQAYNRYWEACGATHHFMSKWLDATTHTSCYHMQCDHYKDIKPPSFYDYPQLNFLSMTRDRQRLQAPSIEDREKMKASDHTNDDDVDLGLRNRKLSHRQGQLPRPSPIEKTHNAQTPHKFTDAHYRSSLSFHKNNDSSTHYGRKSPVSKRRLNLGGSKNEKHKRPAVPTKSINKTSSSGTSNITRGLEHDGETSRRDAWHMGNYQQHDSISNLYNLNSRQVGMESGSMELESDEIYEDGIFDDYESESIPLVGKSRLDGNWGAYYTSNRTKPLSTFVDPHRPNNIDPKGFASTQGGRTPPLFLQELAHLSSLMCAVALSTLRNDKEGYESPLSIYEPGKEWPETDPNKQGSIKERGFAAVKAFFGVGLSAEQRSLHNAALPLPVIGGVSDAEIRFLQIARGPSAKTQLCFNWLTEFIIREHLAGSLGKVGPPIISRIVQFLGDGMIYYNHSRKIMFIPFPFGHAQLSIIFVMSMVFVIPYLMHQYTEEPLVGAILTFLTVLSLEGINEVARDLENPFRNFPNELPVITFQAQYNEALLTMYAGYHPDLYWNGDQVMRMTQPGSREMPSSVRAKSSKSKENCNSSGASGGVLEPISVAELPLTATTNDQKMPPSTIAVAADNSSGSNEANDPTEVADLKRELEHQGKKIEEVMALIGSMGSSSGVQKTDGAVISN